MAVGHACPVQWADNHGLLAGSPLERTWCFASMRATVEAVYAAAPEHPDPRDERLLLDADGGVRLYYTPFDWVNTAAKIMLVGITPGYHQAAEAIMFAGQAIREGLSDDDVLAYVDARASFSGPMRRNLVDMLDGIGVPEALGIATTCQLFGTQHHLAAHCSAISYPLFVRKGNSHEYENYHGSGPSVTGSTFIWSLVRPWLGASMAMVPGALVVPLGTAASEAVSKLTETKPEDRARCLFGFPHPSPANGWRTGQYNARRPGLVDAVGAWAAQRSGVTGPIAVAPVSIEEVPLPGPRAPWLEVWRFALSYNGYDHYGDHELAVLANSQLSSWECSGRLPEELGSARAALFFEQRRAHHVGDDPTGSQACYVRELVERIRQPVTASRGERRI